MSGATVKVKVCGMTRAADAVLASQLGADAIGLVFWPQSPRAVTPGQATEIVRALPAAVTAVGVFVNADRNWVCEVVAGVGLGAVQLHGEESAEYCDAMPVSVLKAVPLDGPHDALRALALAPGVTPLIDVRDPDRRGGTGMTVDWQMAAPVARRRQMYLAGGLNVDNVVQAIDVVRPYGIDVSSGLEHSPGCKDPARMRRFFAIVGGAAQGAATPDS